MLELITTLYFRTERAAQTSLREFPHRVNAAQTFHPSVFKLTSCLYSRDKETGSINETGPDDCELAALKPCCVWSEVCFSGFRLSVKVSPRMMMSRRAAV